MEYTLINISTENKSQYKIQKDFEEEILSGTEDSIKEYLYYYDLSPFRDQSDNYV
jgi:hypothetical protein